METRKIAMACFVSGAVCVAVALLVAPRFWWFGLLAGLAGGYLVYECREVLRAIPVAFRLTQRGSAHLWQGSIMRAQQWLSEKHPFIYPAAVMALPVYGWILYRIGSPFAISDSFWVRAVVCVAVLCVLTLGAPETIWIFAIPIVTFAYLGAKIGERCYWWPFLVEPSRLDETVRSLETKGYHREPLTYHNVYRHWIPRGVWLVVAFFVWYVWKWLFLGVRAIVYFGARCIWELFKLIHSHKRVFCAVHGTAGGTTTYIWLAASAASSLPEKIALVVFGGLCGAAFGVVFRELVSRRWLRMDTNGR